MSISGYAYSSVPKDRSVGINDRVYQEGEYLAWVSSWNKLTRIV